MHFLALDQDPPFTGADGDSNPLLSREDGEGDVAKHKATALKAAEVLGTLGIVNVEEHHAGVQLAGVPDQAGHSQGLYTPPPNLCSLWTVHGLHLDRVLVHVLLGKPSMSELSLSQRPRTTRTCRPNTDRLRIDSVRPSPWFGWKHRS
jgi:hypothetical protein